MQAALRLQSLAQTASQALPVRLAAVVGSAVGSAVGTAVGTAAAAWLSADGLIRFFVSAHPFAAELPGGARLFRARLNTSDSLFNHPDLGVFGVFRRR